MDQVNMPPSPSNKNESAAILALLFAGLFSFMRLPVLNNLFWDDNVWMYVMYTSDNLWDFLQAGPLQYRRALNGILHYYFLLPVLSAPVWLQIYHGLTALILMATSVFMFLLMRRLAEGSRNHALFVAFWTIVLYMDSTYPIHVNIYYKLALLLGIISFWLTAVGLHGKTRVGCLVGAFLLSCFSHYFLHEGSIALEAGRLAMIFMLLARRGLVGRALALRGVAFWSPYLIGTIPLLIYKLKYKSYGIYANTNTMSISNLFNLKALAMLAMNFFAVNWAFCVKHIKLASLSSVIAGSLGLLLGIYVVHRLLRHEGSREDSVQIAGGGLMEELKPLLSYFGIGFALLLPPIFMYRLVNKIPFVGTDSRHAIMMQLGYSIIAGTLCFGIFRFVETRKIFAFAFRATMALTIALGIFFHNMNIDFYNLVTKSQKTFWNAFTNKFPALPDRASFLIDFKIENGMFELNTGPYYDFEYGINMLYAHDRNPNEFRRYLVYSTNNKDLASDWPDLSKPMKRLSNWEEDEFVSGNIICIRYEKGELLVGDEILRKYPDVPYRELIGFGMPELPTQPRNYPLRSQYNGYDIPEPAVAK